jgi:two-component system cell cycle response regulator DivK
VRDGREAVDRARAFRPELIVMDIQMPHVSGLELIEQLKADSDLRSVPIMAVTAYAAKGDEERIREAGAEGYVSKPISLVRFIEAVRALLAAPRPAPEAKDEVAVSRHFVAPPEAVFDAWLDPASAGAWLFATPDGESVRVEIDARVGGRYEIVERRDGEEVLHTGLYEAIERPERLVFTLAVPLYSDREDQVTIVIRPDGDGCELSLGQTRSQGAPASAERIQRGWSHILAALAERLEGDGHD